MKMSARAKRMQRRRKKFGNASLSLVSLMDIFTILVFFLLFNSSGDHQLPSTKAIKLPESIAQEKPTETLLILISNESIIIKGKQVADVNNILSAEPGVIEPMKAMLLAQAQQYWDQEQVDAEEGVAITIMADKQVPYRLLKSVMQTLTETPFKKISLAVTKKAESSS